MEINVDNIPAETKWAMATRAMSGVISAYSKALLDGLGQKQYRKILSQIWSETGQGATQMAKALGMVSDDAKAVGEAFAVITTIALGPEFKTEIVEASKEKTVVKGTGCPFLNRGNEMGITDDIFSAGDDAYCVSLTKSLNANIKVIHEKRMHLGDPYCEWIFEIKR